MAVGHRARVRARLTEENIDTIPESVVLENMLHGVIPRSDTGDAARALLAEFGSLSGVIDAHPKDLKKIHGVGDAAVSFLKAFPLFYRKYMQSKWVAHPVFSSGDEIEKYMSERLIGYEKEVLVVMCLDSNFKMLACKALLEGSIESVHLDIRTILDFAMSSKATRIVIAHNHLCDNVYPSPDDMLATKLIYNILNSVKISLEDHIICSASNSMSLHKNKLMPYQLKNDND